MTMMKKASKERMMARLDCGRGALTPHRAQCALLFVALLATGVQLHAQSTGIFVNSSNNVGIGTTSPATHLEIDHNATNFIRFDGGGGSTNGGFLFEQSTDWSDAFPLVAFTTNDSNTARSNTLVRIHSNETGSGAIPFEVTSQGTLANPTYTALAVNYIGNVGIGTANPNRKLTVAGDAALNGPGHAYFIINGSSGDSEEVWQENGASRWALGMHVGDGTENFNLYNYTTGTTNLSVNQSNGRVGIGTTNPAFALDVSSAQASASRIYLHPTDGSDYALLQFSNSGGTTYFGMDNSNGNGLGSGTAYALTMYAAGVPIVFSSGGAERMRVDTSGNVGIGTASPGAPLDVSGFLHVSGDTNPTIYAQGGYVGWNALSGGTGEMDFINQEGYGSGGFAFFNSNDTTSGRAIVTIDGSGSIFANEFIAASGNVYPDFVFKPGYKVPSLSETEASIKKEGHLPGIPSEQEAKAHGINLADMQVKLLQKIEELTLHQIEQEKLLENQNKRLDEQSQRIGQLEKENTELRAQH
jgi:hypothetical protein